MINFLGGYSLKKTVLFILIIIISVSLFGCTSQETGTQPDQREQGQPQVTDESDREAVKSLVESFGSRLQSVSLLAPKEILEKSMKENYVDFVSEELLAKWLNDPLNAPGRLTSSPWPDRIEIVSIDKISENVYEVKGKIIEITSEEKTKDGIAASRPITLLVRKIDNRWLIDEVTLGEYESINSILYKNTEYGFNFALPTSWEGYLIVTDKWEGIAFGGQKNGEVVQSGPIISIRHPQWTSEIPRQDIPIMIFTFDQWSLLEKEDYHIGAAPIGPKELGRNDKYVFALPARYNFAFPVGYEEVEDILESNPLQPIE